MAHIYNGHQLCSWQSFTSFCRAVVSFVFFAPPLRFSARRYPVRRHCKAGSLTGAVHHSKKDPVLSQQCVAVLDCIVTFTFDITFTLLVRIVDQFPILSGMTVLVCWTKLIGVICSVKIITLLYIETLSTLFNKTYTFYIVFPLLSKLKVSKGDSILSQIPKLSFMIVRLAIRYL